MDKLSREIQSQTTAGLKNKLEDIFEGDTKVPSQFKSVFDIVSICLANFV